MDDDQALAVAAENKILAEVDKILRPYATYTDDDVALFTERAEAWKKAPGELGDWFSRQLVVYSQCLDHLILHPPAGADGLVIVLRAVNLQMKTAVVIHESLIRLRLKEKVLADSRAKVTGRSAHRGRGPGRRSPVGG